MATRNAGKKWTAAQIKQHVAKIREITDKHKRESKAEHSTAVTPEEIERKLKRTKSPMIVSQGWGLTTPGGTVNYSLGIYNPDPTQAIWLFAQLARHRDVPGPRRLRLRGGVAPPSRRGADRASRSSVHPRPPSGHPRPWYRGPMPGPLSA
jgi:hypothetical protein